VVGAVLGLVTHNARLVLLEGSVPTVIFGLGCLGPLWTSRPLMYGMSLEFIGRDTARGREMTSLWQKGQRAMAAAATATATPAGAAAEQ
jgi:hypothetical protein